MHERVLASYSDHSVWRVSFKNWGRVLECHSVCGCVCTESFDGQVPRSLNLTICPKKQD